MLLQAVAINESERDSQRAEIVLDLLDRVAPLSKIVLEVMTTKTITNLVFQTVIKMQLWDTSDYEGIVEELLKRLDTQKK